MVDELVACRFCGKNLEIYFPSAPVFCPYCGGAIHYDTMKNKLSKESNPLTGRAMWSTKVSIVGVLLGMALLVVASVVLSMIILLSIILADTASFTDPFAILDLVESMLLTPTGVAILAFAQLALLVPPLVFVKKYRKPLKERFQLLGWRPYFQDKSFKDGARRFGLDLGISAVVAAAFVGMQFALIMINDVAWGSFSTSGVGIPDMGASITSSNLGELSLLVAAMLFLIGPTEEILFRGFAQQGLETNMGERNGMVLTALLFTLVHVLPGLMPLTTTLYLFFPYFGLSLVICGYYTKTKNLNQLVLIHGLYNTFLVVHAFLVANTATVGSSVILAFTCLGIFAVLGTVVVARWIKHKVVKQDVLAARG